MAMTKEDRVLLEKSEVLNNISECVCVVEFNKKVKLDTEQAKKEMERYAKRLQENLNKANEMNIAQNRINIAIEHGNEMAKECLEENGYF